MKKSVKILLLICLYLTFQNLYSFEKFSSCINETQWDYENTMEYPPNEWRSDNTKKGYDIPTRKNLRTILGISIPRLPHSRWSTSPTTDRIRYFRIAFKEPVEIGTMIGDIGDCEISYLKKEEFYPGDVEKDEQWVKVEDVFKGKSFRAVVFPYGVKIRSIRLKFTLSEKPLKPVPTSIKGIIFLKERLFNIAPFANVFVDSYPKDSAVLIESFGPHRLIDGSLKEWRNSPSDEKPISKENPSWVILKWREPKNICGIYLVNVFGKKLAVDIFTGEKGIEPAVASEKYWKEIGIFEFPVWWRPPYTDLGIKFDSVYKTTALRIRIIEPFTNENPDISYVTKKGKRKNIARIGEIFVFENLKNREIPKIEISKEINPPIEIRYTLPKDSYVSIVINDKNGKRIKNLIANVKRKKGKNIEYWDGTDEDGKIVSPGDFYISGIYRDDIKLKYQFSVYWSGKTPWLLPDGTGGWLSDHCPPRSIAIVKDKIFIGAFLAESGDTLMALDINGNKLWGTKWLNLAGAAFLTTDGEKLYVGSKSGWLGHQGLQMVISELNPQDYKFNRLIQLKKDLGLSGIAVINNELLVSYKDKNAVIGYDIEKLRKNPHEPEKAEKRKIIISQPGELFVCKKKNLLLVISGREILGVDLFSNKVRTIIKENLEEPQSIFVDEDKQEIYVSDRGNCNQVKVFSFSGNLLRAIGKKGKRKAGKYDPLQMSNPYGIAVDKNGKLWVCEEDYQPKRISVWDSNTGKLLKEYLGGPEYGGGLIWLDPEDKTKAYYKGMEFKLNWERGTYSLERIYYRFGDIEHGHIFPYSPDRPFYYKGRKFMVYDFFLHTGYIIIGEDNGEYVKILSCFGSGGWAAGRNPYASKSKELVDILEKACKGRDVGRLNFSWADENGDGLMQEEEIRFYEDPKLNNRTCLLFMYWGSLMNEKDLSIVMRGGPSGALWYLKPSSFTKVGAPFYDLSRAKMFSVSNDPPCGPSGIVLDNEIIFSGIPIVGLNKKSGEIEWTYPNPWGGVHGSHKAPLPKEDRIIGTLRFIGKGKLRNIGEFTAIIGNKGEVYLISEDGLFFGKLFNDHRIAPGWAIFDFPKRDMDVSKITLGEECFGSTFNQIGNEFYLVCGHHHGSIVKVEGLESIRRFTKRIKVSPQDLRKCEDYLVKKMIKEKSGEIKVVSISQLKKPVKIDGILDEWKGTESIEIKKETKSVGRFSFLWDKDALYFSAIIKDKTPMLNLSNDPKIVFKGGDCVDIQLGLLRSPENNPSSIIQGDVRILVSYVKNSPLLVIYKYIVPGIDENKKEIFASPVRSVKVDKVEVITNPEVIFRKTGDGYIVEGKINWKNLLEGFKPELDIRIPFDFGVIFSSETGESVSERIYWSNKLSGTVSDLPSEVEIHPSLWGWLIFKK